MTNQLLAGVLMMVLLGSSMFGCAASTVKSSSESSVQERDGAHRSVASKRECVLADARLTDVLAAHSELVADLESKKYKLRPDALPMNVSLNATIVQSGCNDETLQCSYTCQVQLDINNSPFREIVAPDGHRFWSQDSTFFITSSAATENLTVKSPAEASDFVMAHMMSGDVKKDIACMQAAVAAIKSVPTCNPKEFYRKSK